VVETGVKKEKTVEEVQKEFAKKLLLSLKQGRELILLCSNSAPPMKSKFAADSTRAPAAQVMGLPSPLGALAHN
jgi:hypothetical protein